MKRYRIKKPEFEPLTKFVSFSESDNSSEKWRKLCKCIPSNFLETFGGNYCNVAENSSAFLKKFFCDKVLPYCKAIDVEYPFYESDYLSTYYLYYARKFQYVDKECCRLILYLDHECKNCLGYISLRPVTSEQKVGRSYLNPQIFVNQMGASRNFFVILGQYKIHTVGKEISIRAMPYMQQERVVSVCAHVAIWTILRFFSSRFANSKEYTMGDVVELIKSPQIRKIPSKGLSVEQISTALMDAGFSTIVIRKAKIGYETMMPELIAYIDSGIPVICFSEKKCHAVVACGRSESKIQALSMMEDENTEDFSKRLDLLAEKDNPLIILESRCVDWIIVNDDNRAPYFGISAQPQVKLGQEESVGITNFSQIDFCIVPLYRRMQLSYADAESVFKVLASKNRTSSGGPNEEGYMWCVQKKSDMTALPEKLVVKIFLASANTFREYLRDNIFNQQQKEEKVPAELENLLYILYSRFVWVAQIADLTTYRNGMCSGMVLLDTTCSLEDSNVVIALADQTHCEFVKEEVESHRMQSFSVEYGTKDLRMPLFNRNCEFIKCV